MTGDFQSAAKSKSFPAGETGLRALVYVIEFPGASRTTGNEVKDKTVLLKARKDIEREMERFKVCEKEMKTKAFSKEGLGQAAKLDPQAVARRDMEEWLNAACTRLEDEVRASHKASSACIYLLHAICTI